MTKRMCKKVIFGAAVVGMLSLSGTTVMAGPHTIPITATLQNSTTENVTSDMAWGDIDVNPNGTTTCTMDANGGPATSASCNNGSIASGTITSGQITVESPMSFSITITYPGTGVVVLDDGGTGALPLENILANSTTSPYSHTGGTPSEINIGGELEILAGTDPMGAYTGNMTVTIGYQ